MVGLATTALLAGAAPASAHPLTCSTGKYSHWQDVKKDKRVVVDDLRGAVCFEVRTDEIRFIAYAGRGFYWKQNVRRLGETDLPGPFYWNSRYDVGRPYLTRLG